MSYSILSDRAQWRNSYWKLRDCRTVLFVVYRRHKTKLLFSLSNFVEDKPRADIRLCFKRQDAKFRSTKCGFYFGFEQVRFVLDALKILLANFNTVHKAPNYKNRFLGRMLWSGQNRLSPTNASDLPQTMSFSSWKMQNKAMLMRTTKVNQKSRRRLKIWKTNLIRRQYSIKFQFVGKLRQIKIITALPWRSMLTSQSTPTTVKH